MSRIDEIFYIYFYFDIVVVVGAVLFSDVLANQWVCWQDTLWQPMWLIVAHPAINTCFKSVDCRCINKIVRQKIPIICQPIEEKVFPWLLPCDFFEIFKAVTSNYVLDYFKTISLKHSIYIMHNLIHFN